MADYRARPPGVSLCELVLHGLITEDDVLPGGKVEEQTRIQAEMRYATLTEPAEAPTQRTGMRPHTARSHPRPNLETRPRPQTARGLNRTPMLPRPIPLYRPRSRPIPLPLPPVVTESIGERACCVCREKEKTHAVAPCFHMCVCFACSTLITSCPLCRGPVVSIHRIYV